MKQKYERPVSEIIDAVYQTVLCQSDNTGGIGTNMPWDDDPDLSLLEFLSGGGPLLKL